VHKRESVTKSVTFHWIHWKYPVALANEPSDVPAWDPCRGFPLNEPGPLRHEATPTPSLKALKSWIGKDWEPLPPPTEGYPRIIRAKVLPLSVQYVSPDVDLVTPLSQLARHVEADSLPGKRYLRELLKLAGEYGPVRGPEQNTAREWAQLALEVSVYVEALGVLQDMGMETLEGHVNDRLRLAEPQRRFAGVSVSTPAEGLPLVSRLPERPEGDWRADAIHTALVRTGAALRNATSVDSFRQATGDALMSASTGWFTDAHLTRDGLAIALSVRDRTRYQLAQLFFSGWGAQVCLGCGRYFVPRRRDNRYCHSRCRRLAYSQRQPR
jgi:hypothetical protein